MFRQGLRLPHVKNTALNDGLNIPDKNTDSRHKKIAI